MTLSNLNTQKLRLHPNSESISKFKLPSLLSAQNSSLIIWTLLVLNIFHFILIIALFYPSDFQLSRVKWSGSHFFISYTWNFILFFLACNTDSNFEIYSRSRLPTQNNQWDFCTAEQKVTIYLPLEVLIK